MANMSDPKDSVGKGGSGMMSPEDKIFAELRTKSRAVRDGRASFTFEELNRIVAQLLLER